MQFSAGNGLRISELRAEIANCRPNGDSVMVYYGKLKNMWDELAIYKPIRTCSCGELKTQLEEDREEERTNTFLTGLNAERFGIVRSTIQNIEPLPKLSQVYQRIVRDERQQSMTRSKDVPAEVVGFSANAYKGTSSQYQQREKDITCTHCGKYGHAQADCSMVFPSGGENEVVISVKEGEEVVCVEGLVVEVELHDVLEEAEVPGDVHTQHRHLKQMSQPNQVIMIVSLYLN